MTGQQNNSTPICFLSNDVAYKEYTLFINGICGFVQKKKIWLLHNSLRLMKNGTAIIRKVPKKLATSFDT